MYIPILCHPTVCFSFQVPVTTEYNSLFSPYFLVPKKDGGWYLVINVKGLNHYVLNLRFKINKISSESGILWKGDFVGHLDLKDAYLSVLIAREHRKYRIYSKGHWGY